MLYNEVRPLTLSEVRGQENVVRLLREGLRKKTLPNAMIFTGTRGTGKTTVARIVARSLNCQEPGADGEACCKCEACLASLSGTSVDINELDAASHNGVDDVRAMVEQLMFRPLGKKRVVILDEVHMLSTGAFNALLKVLEEPPQHVVFILCTTELQKVPATVLSRCRKYQFSAIRDEVIVEKLTSICKDRGKNIEKAALQIIAKAAKGSMRDAESIFEPFLCMDGVDELTVRKELGYTSQESVFTLFEAIAEGEPMLADAVIDGIVQGGQSLIYYLEDCFNTLMDIIRVRMGGCVEGSDWYSEQVGKYAHLFTNQRLYEISVGFADAYERRSSNMALVLYSMLTGLCCTQSSITVLEEKVLLLEQVLNEVLSGGSSRAVEGVSGGEKCVDEPAAPVVQVQPYSVPAATECAPDICEPDTPAVQADGFMDLPEPEEVSSISGADVDMLASLGFSVKKPAVEAAADGAGQEEKPSVEEYDDGYDLFKEFARLSSF